jgi:sulfatase modifying factor 1
MRAPLLRLSCLLSLLLASSASAVTMAWTPIGNPGNACDPQSAGCFGSVGYAYSIGTYDVTNAQYAEFLNAKAAYDPYQLYNTHMSDTTSSNGQGGITRSGNAGSYAYSTIPGRENMPVNHVSFIDALRFANWMNNGQGSGGTEMGAYTLLGPYSNGAVDPGAIPSNAATVSRNAGATIVLPTEDEWYKAAYYDSRASSYFAYPTGSNTAPTCTTPTSAPNSANCNHGGSNGLTPVGSYTGSRSPYGTYDQGGNAVQITETIDMQFGVNHRIQRGGDFSYIALWMSSGIRSETTPDYLTPDDFGFRLASVPEPTTGLLVIAGLLGLAGWRRVSA